MALFSSLSHSHTKPDTTWRVGGEGGSPRSLALDLFVCSLLLPAANQVTFFIGTRTCLKIIVIWYYDESNVAITISLNQIIPSHVQSELGLGHHEVLPCGPLCVLCARTPMPREMLLCPPSDIRIFHIAVAWYQYEFNAVLFHGLNINIKPRHMQ